MTTPLPPHYPTTTIILLVSLLSLTTAFFLPHHPFTTHTPLHSTPTPTPISLLDSLNATFSYPNRLPSSPPTHRCGYISIIGHPNMGKSTLMNALLNEQLCATTPLPQTTRHAILGILTTPHTQLLFLDTPGIISTPAYKLQSQMMDRVKSSLRDADLVIYAISLFNDEMPSEEELTFLAKKKSRLIVVVTHVDKSPNDVTLGDKIRHLREVFSDALVILPLCPITKGDVGVEALKVILTGEGDVGAALRNVGRPYEGMYRDGMMLLGREEVMDLIPVGPALYPPDELTDRNERFLASEMIRQAIFSTLRKEVPYCCEVQVERFKEEKKMLRLGAVIHVERDSQKGIVIGKKGAMIKAIGVKAREVLEAFFERKVHLDLSVKVDSNWRNNDDQLKKFGYMSKNS